MFGKNDDFVGTEAFGRAEMKPRDIQAPGTFYEYNDVRINRFSLSLLELYKKQVPDVFRDEVMNPIGASSTWKWVPYTNAYVNIDGKRMASVSGGTRWGGGMWISIVRHGAVRIALAAKRQVGRQADRLARVREGGDHGERTRSRLRLPVVAEHDRQVAGRADVSLRSAGTRRQRDPRRPGSRPGRRVALERAVAAGIQEDRRRYYRSEDTVGDGLQTVPKGIALKGVDPTVISGSPEPFLLSASSSASLCRPASPDPP